MRCWIGFFLIFLAATPGIGLANRVVYVQGAQAPLYAAPRLGGPPVILVGQGTPLTVTGENKRWYRVRGNQKSGWVVKFMVGDNPPVASDGVPDAAVEVLMQRARVRPSTYSTTAAARGLRAGGEGLVEAQGVDYQGVARMEGLQPTASEVTSFFNTGNGHE